MKNRSIVIAGYGSIGKRYVEILSKKNIQLVVFDPKKFKNKNTPKRTLTIFGEFVPKSCSFVYNI